MTTKRQAQIPPLVHKDALVWRGQVLSRDMEPTVFSLVWRVAYRWRAQNI